ncbi:MAG: hypothetical protein C5B59_05305 [Bacteroidetes bacterium]|nr:MAG: hypothetical protein C5B59_05305 [Bacteroidota bacterium]
METTHSEKINSTQYWDQRFITDWKDNHGVEQSQFFSRIAVDRLPPWFIHYVKQHQPSFCDWGCAMGNGTRILCELLSLKNVTGIDFSQVAIEEARSSYPNIQFIAADIQKGEDFPLFDIIFSSNTLEHFDNPWEILERLSCFAKQFIVLLVPFEEYNRHFEHFYTFETTNIPSTLRASHYLTYYSILNAAEYPSSYWDGRQILLIYSTYSELTQLALTLSDLTEKIPALSPDTAIIRNEQNRLQEHLNECAQNICRLKEQMDLFCDSFNKQLDETRNLLAASLSEKEVMSVAIQSLQNEVLANKKQDSEKLRLLSSGLDTAVQCLQSEMSADRKKTAERLLLLNDNLDSVKETLSRGFMSKMKNLFK